MHAVKKTAQAAIALLDQAVRDTPEGFFEEVAHRSLLHALDPAQVDFALLRAQARPRLAVILEEELASR